MILLITAVIAGVALVTLAMLLALLSLAIRAEERQSHSIPGQPPDPLAATARHITGLHVHRTAPRAVYPAPAATRDEGR